MGAGENSLDIANALRTATGVPLQSDHLHNPKWLKDLPQILLLFPHTWQVSNEAHCTGKSTAYACESA